MHDLPPTHRTEGDLGQVWLTLLASLLLSNPFGRHGHAVLDRFCHWWHLWCLRQDMYEFLSVGTLRHSKGNERLEQKYDRVLFSTNLEGNVEYLVNCNVTITMV